MRFLIFILLMSAVAYSQVPVIEPGVSQELAKWRAAHYSDVRYKLNLTLEKMSPVLKGSIEIRVKLSEPPASAGGQSGGDSAPAIILDWRRIKGHEEKSTVTNVSVNGKAVSMSTNWPPANAGGSDFSEHLIFREGVVLGENVIKLDFTSPILTSGSAITRYVDKEDGSEYIYSLFVPSDASTAFPVFDQPDLKARYQLTLTTPQTWQAVSNTEIVDETRIEQGHCDGEHCVRRTVSFQPTAPLSSYVFAFSAGDYQVFRECSGQEDIEAKDKIECLELGRLPNPARSWSKLFVRKSQAAKFKPHAGEVFRLNREAVKYFELYFDYKFPFPKYDLVLIPEFPFGGMEHAGATFLRESSIIFPQEPTKNDHISRATLIFHEAAHQWFGDTVTMRWFDDLWLKEGFATFMGYKALEKIMPEMNSWKVFYERVKQGAYQTDSTKGTTPIYQEIKNLSAAKSAYGNIVYNKAPAFLRQAEFYLGEDKFQTAVRAFLKKHEYANAGWENLVREFEVSSDGKLDWWAEEWVRKPGVSIVRVKPHVGKLFRDGNRTMHNLPTFAFDVRRSVASGVSLPIQTKVYYRYGSRAFDVAFPLRGGSVVLSNGAKDVFHLDAGQTERILPAPDVLLPNYQDYGYGIFLLDDKSRDYVLKNIQNEKDPFLRSMMWGALWDSVREGELDPREFVELVVKVLMQKPAREQGRYQAVDSYALADARASATDDESTVALLLNRVGTAMNYYMASSVRSPHVSKGSQNDSKAQISREPSLTVGLQTRVENMLIERMQNAESLGQRITFYRAFLNNASSENARKVLRDILNLKFEIRDFKLKTKDRFDIVTRLLILNDPDAPRLLADLEKTETSDDAKRYAYAAKAGIPTAENKAKYWNDFTNNKEISESWIEAAFGPWNSIRHSELTLPYLQKALQELPNHKRNRKIFFVNGWLGAFIGGQRSEEALAIVNKFLADNPNLDKDLRLKILENVDLIERAVRIRSKYGR